MLNSQAKTKLPFSSLIKLLPSLGILPGTRQFRTFNTRKLSVGVQIPSKAIPPTYNIVYFGSVVLHYMYSFQFFSGGPITVYRALCLNFCPKEMFICIKLSAVLQMESRSFIYLRIWYSRFYGFSHEFNCGSSTHVSLTKPTLQLRVGYESFFSSKRVVTKLCCRCIMEGIYI